MAQTKDDFLKALEAGKYERAQAARQARAKNHAIQSNKAAKAEVDEAIERYFADRTGVPKPRAIKSGGDIAGLMRQAEALQKRARDQAAAEATAVIATLSETIGVVVKLKAEDVVQDLITQLTEQLELLESVVSPRKKK